MCVLFFLSKSCIKISWAWDQITHYIYINFLFFIFLLFFFTINQVLLKITNFKWYNPKHPSWSHISDDPASKATIYKTIPIVNKALLSKLTSYLIYISHIPNETWSISFVKFSMSSSMLLKLLLMCGCSNIAIATKIYFLTAIINKQFQTICKTNSRLVSWSLYSNTKAN